MNEELSGWKVAAILAGIAAAFAYVGAGDYEDAVEAEARIPPAKVIVLPCETAAECEDAADFGIAPERGTWL